MAPQGGPEAATARRAHKWKEEMRSRVGQPGGASVARGRGWSRARACRREQEREDRTGGLVVTVAAEGEVK
ncbi:hypothetical protein NL676_017609 [Syzygium grande]|nr:hypothetical protein NL676_017609 [Syzygium grande]